MKPKYILFFLSFLFISLMPLAAQEHEHQHKNFDIEKFKKKKADFLISEIGLTDAEAKAFIPLANELMDKRFELNRSVKKNVREIRGKKDKSAADYNILIDASLEIRTKELQLDKEYYQKFKKVLSPEKIYKYQRAENKFMRNMVGGNNKGNKEIHRKNKNII